MREHLGRLAVAAVLATLAGPVGAQEKIKLKVAGFLPLTHFQVVNGSNVWMDEVKRLTNGRVEFEYYPAEQMGKAAKLMDLVQAGVFDVAEIAPAYVTEKLPLIGVLEMPGLVQDSCSGARALRAVASPGGAIYESDFKTSRIRPLTFFIYPPYKVVVAPKAVAKVEDFQGLKLRTSGGVMELATATLGGVAVRMASPEIYQSLSRRTIDGVFFSFLSAKDADLQSVSKHVATGYNFGAPSVIMGMSDRRFNALPKDIQDALIQAGPRADQSYCAFVDKNEALQVDEFRKQGVAVTAFSDEERARLAERLRPVETDWVKGLDGRGKPATRALDAFRKELGGATH